MLSIRSSWSDQQVSDDALLDEVGDYDDRIRPSLQLGGDGRLYVVWADEREGPNTDALNRNYDVYLSMSEDGGVSWSADRRVNNQPDILNQSNASLVVVPGHAQDQVLVSWADLRAADAQGNRYAQLLYEMLSLP